MAATQTRPAAAACILRTTCVVREAGRIHGRPGAVFSALKPVYPVAPENELIAASRYFAYVRARPAEKDTVSCSCEDEREREMGCYLLQNM